MYNNFGFISNNISDLNIFKKLPNNTYIFYCLNKKTINDETIQKCVNYLISNDCREIFIASDLINKIEQKTNKKFKTINDNLNVKSYSNDKKVIVYNFSNKKIKAKDKYIINYNRLNLYRKDAKPDNTIKKIKQILKDNNIKVKEKYIKRNINNVYSIRLELDNHKGSNGKGLSLKLAKASAYAELMERLQSNMINKKRISTKKVNKKNKLYDSLLYKGNKKYKEDFFKLNNIYFNTEKILNIKNNNKEEIPINAINSFCHTNGLASGNSFSEAVNQAIFEIIERYTYQELLNSTDKVKNINIEEYPINKVNRKLLNKLNKLGYHYYIKDCSLGKYPAIGLLLLNKDNTKYSFNMASDISFDIALSRAITEMLQGINIKELNKKMLDRISLNELNKKYKYNYKSYNWLKCFNNNIGYLPDIFFNLEYSDIKSLSFKNYLTNNDEILNYLKRLIDYDIYVKDYNIMGFDTYRVYIPYMTTVDCYDNCDLIINKHYNKLFRIYTNIEKASMKEINFFINIFLDLNKQIKYDELIKPTDLFHLNEISDYYKLDFTSLLIILCLMTGRENDIVKLLKFKLNNFNLSNIKSITYKILINLLNEKSVYKLNNLEIENGLREIIKNPKKYLSKLNPIKQENDDLLSTKKSLI